MNGRAPSRSVVGEFFADVIVMRPMAVDMEKIPWHEVENGERRKLFILQQCALVDQKCVLAVNPFNCVEVEYPESLIEITGAPHD